MIIPQYNYYVCNKGLLEECDREENVKAVGAATASCLKRRFVKHFVQCHVFAQSLPGRCPIAKCPVNTSHCFRFV